MTRRRLKPEERRAELLDIGAELFAARPYDDVLMEDIAERAGASRALLYRYFPAKRDLFAAIYQRAADRLVTQTEEARSGSLEELVRAGLEAHLEYFAANKLTVLAANRALAGDPVIQTIVNDELTALLARMLDASGLRGRQRVTGSAVLRSWLVFVREMCLSWLENDAIGRDEVHEICVRALLAALAALPARAE
ncbi:TetR/AcrR family transcriptional regulator [Amycolatopsis acidicola]|uniref:TetR/AcrR family transcriptional regulator n=1 Tax=Amycolatopsis acidicola TaxID=2596893 RepID=A0A5N0UMW8_9PSEU|nr:TetR/AcrR family transcriptional regulator [Amycolatopsis acidicola]KAA9149192.1 TetR/AcrR family transcriptional regulator [Amycolatopsis acidicola]